MTITQITVSKKLVYGVGIGLITLLAILFFGGKSFISNRAPVHGNELAAGSPEKFALLSGQGPQRSVGST